MGSFLFFKNLLVTIVTDKHQTIQTQCQYWIVGWGDSAGSVHCFIHSFIQIHISSKSCNCYMNKRGVRGGRESTCGKILGQRWKRDQCLKGGRKSWDEGKGTQCMGKRKSDLRWKKQWSLCSKCTQKRTWHNHIFLFLRLTP